MSEFQTPERHARLLAHAQSLTPPAGWKIEISGDEIIMTAGPSVIHQRNLLLIRRQFEAHEPAGMMPSATPTSPPRTSASCATRT
ncbi:hypothetical protein [Kitasatospora sp. NPDC001095]